LKEWLHLNRNHYDRVTHFSFGFLLLYRMRELLTRSAHARERWGTWLAVAALAALSSFFEIIELLSRKSSHPSSALLISARKATFEMRRKIWRGRSSARCSRRS
jgi:uncharacterized membrane protein (DUF2068 family)